jgi:hypothetical protein
MSAGPLDDERLRAVETCLDEARFEEAQKQLAELGGIPSLGPGVAYLTARLLFARGRIDQVALEQKLQDLLADFPDFEAARILLEAHGGVPPEAPTLRASLGVRMTESASRIVVASKRPTDLAPPASLLGSGPPPRLETPRVPSGKLSDPRYLGTATTQPVLRKVDTLPELELDLDPPRSELPTEPAPPPSDGDAPSDADTPFDVEEPRSFSKSAWDPLEAELVHQRTEAAFQGLEQLARARLDQLLAKNLPELPGFAGEAADFLGTAPISSHFAPFDLTLDSLDRLDALLSVFLPAKGRSAPYALSLLLTAYVGECVRGAGGGRWEGKLGEPERVKIERRSGEAYVPWARVKRALTDGSSLRVDAGPRPHPAAEPPERPARSGGQAKTPWDPEPWPDLALLGDLGRSLPNSVIGVWAARVAKQALDRTPSSLPAIDRYMTLITPVPGITSAAPWTRRPAVLTGAYLGEILCLHAAGRWSENDAAPGPLRYEVLMPDGSAAYPVLWTYEQLHGRARLTLRERVQQALSR